MKIDAIKQPNFKSLYTKDERFNERERMIDNDISKKLFSPKPNDEKGRTWNEWLKKEKGVDIFVKRTKNTCDMLTVFGVKNVKDFDDAAKMKDFFVVGNYHTTDFDPQHVLTAYKEEKQANAFALGTLALVALGCIGAFLFFITNLENSRAKKEIPQKVIQMKDSIVDTLKMTKIK